MNAVKLHGPCGQLHYEWVSLKNTFNIRTNFM